MDEVEVLLGLAYPEISNDVMFLHGHRKIDSTSAKNLLLSIKVQLIYQEIPLAVLLLL